MRASWYKIAIPQKWEDRKNAGLCPVCAKTKEEFDSNRKIYCSADCADEYSKHFVHWDTLRQKKINESPKCNDCGVTKEKWEKMEKKKVEERLKYIYIERKDEIRNWKMAQLAKLEEQFIKDLKAIENANVTNHWRLKHFLEEEFKVKLDREVYFEGFDVDHVIALMNGGEQWDEDNLQVLCKPCHKKKTRQDFKIKKLGGNEELKKIKKL